MAAITRPVPDEKIFHGLLGDITMELDRFTEADPVGVLASLLSTFSAYIGNGPRIVSRGKPMPLAIWPVLVGVSGIGRKGTATNLAMEVIESAFYDFHNTNIVGGFPATGLGFMETLEERKDATGKVRPMQFIEEEMDSFIKAATKDARLGTNVRKAWDGSTLTHKTAKDDYRVSKPHLGIIGHAQPKNWARIRNSADATGGTYNRFLPLFVHRSKSLPVFGGQADMAEIITRCGHALRQAGNFAQEVKVLTVPKSVAARFEKYHRPECDKLTGSTEELSEFAERAMAYMLRIGGVFCLSDRRTSISIEDFDAALALITYSVQSVIYVMNKNRQFSGRSALAQKTAEALDEFGPMTITALWSKVGRHVLREHIEDALIELGDDILRFMPVRKGPGRPGLWVCLKNDLPEGVKVVNEDGEEVAPSTSSAEAEEEDPTVTIKVEVIRDEPIKDEPQKPVERLELTAAPKAAPKAQEAPKAPQKPAQPPKAGPAREPVNGEKIKSGRKGRKPQPKRPEPNPALAGWL